MKRFRGQVEHVFDIPQKGAGFMLTHVEGDPVVGMKVALNDARTTILELGRNTTDGKPISDRDCLTGQPCPRYGAVRLDWSAATAGLRGLWIEEVTEQ